MYPKSIRISEQGVEENGMAAPRAALLLTATTLRLKTSPPLPVFSWKTHGHSAAPRPESAEAALPGDNPLLHSAPFSQQHDELTTVAAMLVQAALRSLEVALEPMLKLTPKELGDEASLDCHLCRTLSALCSSIT